MDDVSFKGKVILAWAAAVVLMIIYPPFEFVGGSGVAGFHGYDWLVWPDSSPRFPLRVAVIHLFLQVLAVSVVAAAAIFIAKDIEGQGSA